MGHREKGSLEVNERIVLKMNKYELIEIDLTKVLNASKEEKVQWSKIVVDQFYKIGFLEMV